jgi:hypothetical protein
MLFAAILKNQLTSAPAFSTRGGRMSIGPCLIGRGGVWKTRSADSLDKLLGSLRTSCSYRAARIIFHGAGGFIKVESVMVAHGT